MSKTPALKMSYEAYFTRKQVATMVAQRFPKPAPNLAEFTLVSIRDVALDNGHTKREPDDEFCFVFEAELGEGS